MGVSLSMDFRLRMDWFSILTEKRGVVREGKRDNTGILI